LGSGNNAEDIALVYAQGFQVDMTMSQHQRTSMLLMILLPTMMMMMTMAHLHTDKCGGGIQLITVKKRIITMYNHLLIGLRQ
jgi:hypothetical protein